MFIVGSFNNENMEDMAVITDKIKQEYCDRHNYIFHSKKNNWRSSNMGFARIHFVKEIFELYPKSEWLFLVDCDATITNLNIKIENRVDNRYHVIYTAYFNGLNVGVALFRNTDIGRRYIDYILSLEEKYNNHPWAEQQAIIDTFNNFNNIIKIVPAKFMNGVEKNLYTEELLPVDTDILGTSMLWEAGDWCVHWCGVPHNKRVERAKTILGEIIR